MYVNILEEIQFSITSTTEMSPEANQHKGHLALVKAIEKRNKEQATHEVTEYITLFKRIAAKNGEKK